MVDVEVVDTSNNYYDADRQTVVLDGKLKQFPKGFEYMKRHELRHHKIYVSSGSRFDVFVRTFWHEFSTDLDYAFSNSEDVTQLRRYIQNERGIHKPYVRFLVQCLREFLGLTSLIYKSEVMDLMK